MLEERPVADDLAFPPRMYQVARSTRTSAA
jgi:hypothetical protein